MLEESVYTDSLIFIKKYDIIYIERKEKKRGKSYDKYKGNA